MDRPARSGSEPPPPARHDGFESDEAVRRRRLREQGRRPLADNLAEGIALSEFLASFTGAARRVR
ncbi:MAG: hypothetical protein ACR2J6_00005 [Thermoleophilaceae bacterium]